MPFLPRLSPFTMDAARVTPQDHTLAEALDSLSNATRLALLRQLRAPRVLRDIEVRVAEPGDGERTRPVSRQGVRQHLDKLLELGIVEARPLPREQQGGPEYLVNHQRLYALAEEFRELARLRAAEEVERDTLQGRDPAPKWTIQGPCLVLVKGLDEGRTFPLPAAPALRREWVLGRRRGASVSLDFDPFVSSDHAVVVHEHGTYYVEDLPDSRNGTFLNFEALPKGMRRALHTGDLVGVGRCLLMFRA